MQFVANFMSCDQPVVSWSQQREAEGWHLLGCADHLYSATRPFPHVWATLGAMAVATSRVGLTSSFANNLLRSPVEVAQAALQIQQLSDGRFECGLGAGWSSAEILGAGMAYPAAGERASRYREAIEVVCMLLRARSGQYRGSFYDIDVPFLGPNPVTGPPPLIASLGGNRTIREIAPLVDRVELKMISAATRDGELDLAAMASIPADHLADLVRRVREVAPSVPLGVFVLCSAGTDERTRRFQSVLGDSFLGGFFGEPAKVASSMLALASFGIDRIQVSPFNDTTFEALAPLLGLSSL